MTDDPLSDADAAEARDAAERAAFMGWLNGQRKLHGLPSLIHDAWLSDQAFLNNKSQHEKGLGHWAVVPSASQCVGDGTFDQVTAMWMGDGTHFNILMGRYLNRAGYDHDPPFWTVNVAS